MRSIAITFLLCFSLCVPTELLAQAWKPVSAPIYGGLLDRIIADEEGVLYGNDGLYVVTSADNGLTWSPISPRSPVTLEDLNLDAGLAVIRGPFKEKIVVLYPKDGDFTEIYTSLDGGDTWSTSQVPEQLKGAGLFVAGLSSGKGLAFVRSTNSASTTSAFSTSDGGQTWNPETGFTVMPSSIHESASGITYVADFRVIRRKAVDGTWSAIPLPLVGTPIQGICTAGERLFLASPDAVFSTTNDGSTWATTTFDSSGAKFSPLHIIGFPDGGAVLFAQNGRSKMAVFRLKADSLVWTMRQDSLKISVNLPIGFGENNIIFPGLAGPFFSDSWGSEWDFRPQGISIQPIWRFAAQGTSIVAVSFGGDIFRGSIDGSSWDFVDHREAVYDDMPRLDVVGIAPSTYLLSTTYGVFRSEDDGNTWDLASGLWGLDFGSNLCVRDNGSIITTTRRSIQTSSDLGLTWSTLVIEADNRSLRCIVETKDGSLYVAAEQGLFRFDGTTLTSVYQLNVPAWLAVAADSNAQVYGVVGGGGFDSRLEFAITRDGGNTWTSQSLDTLFGPGPEPPVFDAVITNAGHLFVSSVYGLIHMTPTGSITTEPNSLRSFSLGLELDAEEHLWRSGFSIIEKNDHLVSVEEQATVISTSVYPAPSRDVVRIAGISTMLPTPIRIVNALGVCVAEQILTADNGIATLDVRSLVPGTYTAIIVATGQSASLVILR